MQRHATRKENTLNKPANFVRKRLSELPSELQVRAHKLTTAQLAFADEVYLLNRRRNIKVV